MASSTVSASAPSDPDAADTSNASDTTESFDSASEHERDQIAHLRYAASEAARPKVKAGAAPIRVMARMVADLEAQCRELAIAPEVAAGEIINRTIGDVDVRRISARDDGPEFVSLADDMGLALPRELIDGVPATGKRYRWIHRQMESFERQLLARHSDLRMYDLNGIGNPLLREMLSDYLMRVWGFTLPASQIHLSLGSLDGLNKFFQGYTALLRQRLPHTYDALDAAVIFPAPGFNVPEWQAQSLGLRIHRLRTSAENQFKVTPDELRATLAESPDIRVFYLTVSSNPTAFAYTPEELRALCDVLRECAPDVIIAADLAYIGTGEPAADRARMAVFNDPAILSHCVLFCSFSKTHTLTGDRCGFVVFGDPDLATALGPGWTNGCAALPAEWQLRYMAYVKLFGEHPEIEERIRALYRLRRGRLGRQLERLNQRHNVFARINLDDGGTVYNWSQLNPGEDVFSLFCKTGIAGVPGSAFGYSDDFVRLSVGCIPVPAADDDEAE
jgi:aspartate/methionine/tyrosine aminotransferase